MTVHAIYALGSLGEDELVNVVLADLALEAVSVVTVVTSHDGFVEDNESTKVAAVAAVAADWRAVTQERKIGVGDDLVATFGAFEAVDVKERLSRVAKNKYIMMKK
jgi:hypothetical protein